MIVSSSVALSGLWHGCVSSVLRFTTPYLDTRYPADVDCVTVAGEAISSAGSHFWHTSQGAEHDACCGVRFPSTHPDMPSHGRAKTISAFTDRQQLPWAAAPAVTGVPGLVAVPIVVIAIAHLRDCNT